MFSWLFVNFSQDSRATFFPIKKKIIATLLDFTKKLVFINKPNHTKQFGLVRLPFVTFVLLVAADTEKQTGMYSLSSVTS